MTKSDAIVLLSKSGTTEELLNMLPYVLVPKERIIALVGNVNSPIAQKSGIVLDASVEKEACINDSPHYQHNRCPCFRRRHGRSL